MNDFSNIKFIGCTGLARSGKNLFCDIAAKQLKDDYKLNSTIYALADGLKQDCKEFIQSKLNLDAFTSDSEQKKIFRPLLVTYAQIKRDQTKGRYWLELLEKRIKSDLKCNTLFDISTNVIIISDIRFNEFEKDEIYWIKNELHGKVVHISQYIKDPHSRMRIFTLPPNSTEAENDPKVKACADYCIEWEYHKTDDPLASPYLNHVVRECLKTIVQV